VIHGWRHVVYDPSEQVQAAARMLRHLARTGPGDAARDQHAERAAAHARLWLQTLLALFKHPAFAAEREARFVATATGAERCRTSSGRLVPYVVLTRTDAGAPAASGTAPTRDSSRSGRSWSGRRPTPARSRPSLALWPRAVTST
jgi:hypothetical protein